MIRVAALQFASTTDVETNLATCLRMIDKAAQKSPALMVLPEFSNHLSWYDDVEHARRVAATLDGTFLRSIAAAAADHRCHIAVNVSLLDGERLTVSTLLYDDTGNLLSRADKQTLMGHENLFFSRADQPSSVVQAKFARLGLYPCRDGVTMETPRCLALSGAQVMINSLNSFALDEASLHVPARAAENRVFVVAANKVGLLVPESELERVSALVHVPPAFLVGAGESQIVAPDGRVLARAERTGEAVIVADIDPSEADHKLRADGTHVFGMRRPELYRPIAARPRAVAPEETADVLSVALLTPPEAESVDETVRGAAVAIRELASDGVQLIVLPELFYLPGGRVEHPAAASDLFVSVVRAIAEALTDTAAHVVFSAVERSGPELFHMGLLVGARGVVARQPQLHVPLRHAFATPGRRLDSFRLPWGRLAICVGEDLCVPELLKVHALSGVMLVASPFAVNEAWELSLGARSRAAENRMVLAVATRGSEHGTSSLFDLTSEFTIMEPWQNRSFDGLINDPLVTALEPGQTLIRQIVSLGAAANKLMSADTHLLDGRPWQLLSDLTKRGLGVPVVPDEPETSELEAEASEAEAPAVESDRPGEGDEAAPSGHSDEPSDCAPEEAAQSAGEPDQS